MRDGIFMIAGGMFMRATMLTWGRRYDFAICFAVVGLFALYMALHLRPRRVK